MTDTVASLGFEVESKSVKDATQDLKGLSDQAAKTSDSVGKLQPSMQTLEATSRRAGVGVDELKTRTAAFNAESARLTSASTAAGSAIGTIAKEAAAVAPALSAVGSASRAVTQEHNAHTAALGGLRSSLKGMSPLLNEFGGGLGTVLGATKSLRLGLEGFAIVAGGAAAFGLAKLGDEIKRNKADFEALTGSAKGGADTYNAVKAAAQGAGIEFDTLKGAVEKATQGLSMATDKNVIFANSGDKVAKFAQQLTGAFSELGKVMQTSGATAEEEAKVFGTLGQSIAKTGTLTVDAFQSIRDSSITTARAISSAFGFQDIDEFQKQLAKTPITAQQLIDRINLIKPAIDAAFDERPINTVEQGVRQLKDEWKLLLQQMADGGSFNFVVDFLKTLSTQLKQDIADAQALASALGGIGGAAGGALGNAGQVLRGNGQGGSSSASYDANGNVTGGAQQDFTGGNTSSSPYGGTEFMSMGPQSGNDPSAVDYGGGSSDYGYFADGGQFTVGGTGGTDSQNVSFKATPGEVVTVTTPGGGGVSSTSSSDGSSVKDITDAISQSTIDITKQVTAGSDNIVLALNKLIGGVASTTVNPSTGLSVANTNTTGAAASPSPILPSPAGSSGGAGGFNTRKSQPEPMVDQGQIDPKSYFGNPAYGYPGSGGLIRGTGRPVRGGSAGGAGSFPYRQPAGQFAGGGVINSQATDYNGDGNFNGSYNPDGSTSDFYGTNYDGSGDFYGSLSDYGAGSSDYYGTNYDGSGTFTGSISDVGYTDILSGGNDTGAIDYGGGSADMGYFATGGSFKVGGDGGTDTTPVFFHATKGETVTITPPSGVNVSAPQMGQADDPSQSTSSTTTKTVNIHVQAGVQADDFIRSRAQIARGI